MQMLRSHNIFKAMLVVLYRVGQKKPDHFLKCMTPVYDEVGKRSTQ